MNKLIQIRKQRDLGDILSDSLSFLKQNRVVLFRIFLKFVAPVLIVLMLLTAFYYESFSNLLSLVNTETLSSTFVLSFFLIFGGALVFYAVFNGMILHSIKSYMENNGQIVEEEVQKGIKKDFGRLLAASLLFGLTVGFGLALCLIPGIYLGVTLAPVFAVIVFDQKSPAEAFRHCFKIIEGEWFRTFLVFIVLFLLVYFIGMIFQIPQLLYLFIQFIITDNHDPDPASFFNWITIALSLIAQTFQYITYGLVILASALVYFNLHEKKYHSGTFEIIDSLGTE